MHNAEVRNFLGFVTGSSALVIDEIKVTFNGLSGLSRRPIAHTCSSTLELPVSYATYLEFAQEFDFILTTELSWIMMNGCSLTLNREIIIQLNCCTNMINAVT